MREKKEFANRTKVLSSDNPIKKYFLVCEGKETEYIYFDAISRCKDEIGILPMIELVPIIRNYSESSWSNPEKIVDRLILNLEEDELNYITYRTLIDRMITFFIDEELLIKTPISIKMMFDELKNICLKFDKNLEDKVENSKDSCENFLRELGDCNIICVVDFLEIGEKKNFSYEKGFDKISIIVDRDEQSFKEKQYDDVINKCAENDFVLYVSNPCFEFWLLLHFDEVKDLDIDKIKKNPKKNKHKRYCEVELKKCLKKYKKSNYDADKLVKNVDTAISNEKRYCEDIEKLKNEVGCNIGLLIEDMRKSN